MFGSYKKNTDSKIMLFEKTICIDDIIFPSDKNLKKSFKKCYRCKKIYFKAGLKTHMCHVQLTCDYCSKSFSTKSKISFHIKGHMKAFLKKDNTLKSEAKGKKRNLICKICGRKFSIKASLVQHIKSHKNTNKKSTEKTCDTCGKEFANVSNLIRHRVIVHTGKKPHECNVCGKTYSHKRDFEYHYQKTHSSFINVLQTSTLCEFCNKTYVDKAGCNRHKKYHCTMNKNKIEKTKRWEIKMQLKYTCDICQKTYNQKDSLATHMKSHLGTNLIYQCDNCNKSFTRKHNLRGHIQSKHMNLRLHSCDKCKNTFTSRWALLCHRKIPCQSKQCNVCHKTFKRIKFLEKHIKLHITNPEYHCKIYNNISSNEHYVEGHNDMSINVNLSYFHNKMDSRENEVIDDKTLFSNNQSIFNIKQNIDKNIATDIKIKHEAFNSDTDCEPERVNFNSKSRIIYEEDKENFSEDHQLNDLNARDRREIIPMSEEKQGYGINIDFMVKQEPVENDNAGTDLVNFNSRNRIVFKEDTENLYENHTIKEELVLGPEVIQKNTDNITLRKKTLCPDGDILESDKRELQCDGWNKIDPKAEYKKHIQQFICDYCNKKFNTKLQIYHHMKKHMKKLVNKLTKDKVIKYDKVCKICRKKFHLEKSLMQHMKSHDKSNKNDDKTCGICGQFFIKPQSLVRHVKIVHAGIKPHCCNECGKSFTHKSDFEYHYQKIHMSISTIASCELCCKILANKATYNRHKKYYCAMNEKKIEKKHTCNVCQKNYSQKDGLQRHKMLMHSDTSTAACTKVVTRESSVYQCDICNKTFTRKFNLIKHIQTKHLNLKAVSCDRCKKSFTSRWALTCHIRKQSHLKHTCNICRRSFTKINHLTRHEKIHLHDTSSAYQCDMCNKIYPKKQTLQCHIQKQHTHNK